MPRRANSRARKETSRVFYGLARTPRSRHGRRIVGQASARGLTAPDRLLRSTTCPAMTTTSAATRDRLVRMPPDAAWFTHGRSHPGLVAPCRRCPPGLPGGRSVEGGGSLPRKGYLLPHRKASTGRSPIAVGASMARRSDVVLLVLRTGSFRAVLHRRRSRAIGRGTSRRYS